MGCAHRIIDEPAQDQEAGIVDVAALSARITPRTVWTFVRVRDAAGRCGWGEGTLQDRSAGVHAHVERLAPMLVGRAMPSTVDIASVVGTRGDTMEEAAAISALDQAVCDLSAQQHGRPLSLVLGTPRRTTIPLYANINRGTIDRSPAGFAARAHQAATSGFDAIKIAPFDDVRPESADTQDGRRLLQRGIDRVAAVRAAIGPAKQLLVDCHWRLTEASAHEALRALEPVSLHWFECPLPEEPPMFAALRRLRGAANERGVRLAGCESLTGIDAFRAFLDADVYDVIMPDVKYAGGLAEMLRIGDAAAARGASCSPHNPSGPIAHVHSVHVSAALPSFTLLEFQYGESPLFFEIVDGELPDPRAGTSAIPASTGLGVRIDIEQLRPLCVDAGAEAQLLAAR